MILKLTQIFHLYNYQKGAKTVVKRAPLTHEERVKDDRIVTALFFGGVLVSSILYTVL